MAYDSDYLPAEAIMPMLTATFPSLRLLIMYTPEHLLITTTVRDALAAPVVNWRLNRPPDPIRTAAYAHYLQRTHRPIDSMLIISCNHRAQQFEILDGAHRYRSLQLLPPTHPLLDTSLLLNLRINATEGELVEIFQNINKCIPVPDLYLRDTEKDRRACIERIAATWQLHYASHFRSTISPLKPNTNRDRFMEFLDHAYTVMKLTFETEHQLVERLKELNEELKANPIPEKQRQQCEASGCYLFTKRLGELEMML